MKYRRLKIWLDMITNVDKSKVTKEIWQEHLDVICQNIIKEAKQERTETHLIKQPIENSRETSTSQKVTPSDQRITQNNPKQE